MEPDAQEKAVIAEEITLTFGLVDAPTGPTPAAAAPQATSAT